MDSESTKTRSQSPGIYRRHRRLIDIVISELKQHGSLRRAGWSFDDLSKNPAISVHEMFANKIVKLEDGGVIAPKWNWKEADDREDITSFARWRCRNERQYGPSFEEFAARPRQLRYANPCREEPSRGGYVHREAQGEDTIPRRHIIELIDEGRLNELADALKGDLGNNWEPLPIPRYDTKACIKLFPLMKIIYHDVPRVVPDTLGDYWLGCRSVRKMPFALIEGKTPFLDQWREDIANGMDESKSELIFLMNCCDDMPLWFFLENMETILAGCSTKHFPKFEKITLFDLRSRGIDTSRIIGMFAHSPNLMFEDITDDMSREILSKNPFTRQTRVSRAVTVIERWWLMVAIYDLSFPVARKRAQMMLEGILA